MRSVFTFSINLCITKEETEGRINEGIIPEYTASKFPGNWYVKLDLTLNCVQIAHIYLASIIYQSQL